MRLAALRWLIADTFRQSLWSGVFLLMLGVTGLCVTFSLASGFTRLGANEAAVRSTQFALAGLGANTLGLLLALTFTGGFLPAFVDPAAAHILLAKPVRRWLLFLGKFLGVLAFFTVQAAIFILATWIAFGISTGYWPASYFAALPVLVLNFAAFFSFSALLAVMTRNMVACVFGAVVFWLLCVLMNLGRHALFAYDLEQFSAASRFLSEVGYWLLPRPADTIAVLHDAMTQASLASEVEEFARVQDAGAFRPGLSLGASLLFPLLVVAMAGYELETHDY